MSPEEIQRMVQASRDAGDFDEDWEDTDTDANVQAALDEDDKSA